MSSTLAGSRENVNREYVIIIAISKVFVYKNQAIRHACLTA